MKIQHLLEARNEFYAPGYFPKENDKAWSKRYKSRILLSYRPPTRLDGLDQQAVAKAYEKALAKFKELRDAHPTKLMFKNTNEADEYMKKMEYPGWTMVTQFVFERSGGWNYKSDSRDPNYFTIEWGDERKDPLNLEKQEYKPSLSVDEVTFTEVEGGRIEIKTTEKSGPKFRIWLTALQNMPKKFKGKNSTGRDMTDYFVLERARPTKITFLGSLEDVKAAFMKGFAKGVSYERQDHNKKQGALDKRKTDAKASAQYQKQRKEDLYKKYGKHIVDRVKIKAMSIEGDDGYQWAMFVDGSRRKSGMTQYQARGEQEMMWAYLAKWEKMSPEEQMKEIQAAEGWRAYLAYRELEHAIDSQLPSYLDAIKKNAKAYVDSKQAAKDGIDLAKVSDPQAKKIFNDLMKKLRDKND